MLVGGIACDQEIFIFMCFSGFTFHLYTDVITAKATGREYKKPFLWPLQTLGFNNIKRAI